MEVVPCSELTTVKNPVAGVILVDLSWLLHRSYYAHQELSVEIGGVEVQTGGIYGVLRGVMSVLDRKMDHAVILCQDGKHQGRYKACPGYKAGRDDTNKRDIYLQQQEILAMASTIPGVYCCHHPDFEADDVIWTLSQTFKKLGPVLIYASDKDLTQCLGVEPHPVTMFQHLKGRKFEENGPEYPKKSFGVLPEEVVLFRALVGDGSDNLKGYFRFPRKLAVQIAERFIDAEDFLTAPEDIQKIFEKDMTKAMKGRLKQVRDDPGVLRRNYYVMKLKTVPRPPIFKVTGGGPFLQKYGMRALAEKVLQFREARDGFLQA